MREYWEFVQECWKWAWERHEVVVWLVRTLLFAFVLLGLFGVGFSIAEGKWQWALLLVPIAILMLLVAPYFVWRKERGKVKEYETQALDLIAEDNDQYLQKRGKNWIIRVGIKTLGMKSVNNVEVTLTNIDGRGNSYLDAPLRPAYCLPNEPSAFTVKPRELRFVEVFSWGKGDAEIGIHYNYNYQLALTTGHPPKTLVPFLLNSMIPAGEHRITLCATGDNIQPVEREFDVSTAGEKPSFKGLNPSENGMKAKS